jgi:hypothetical protein
MPLALEGGQRDPTTDATGVRSKTTDTTASSATSPKTTDTTASSKRIAYTIKFAS